MKRSSPEIMFLGVNEMGRRIQDWLLDQGEQIACLLTRREQLPLIRRLKPDLVLCCGFRHLLPGKLLDVPALGCINVHASYLPHNRGTYTNVWSIIENTPAGVSIHKMVPRVDSGPLISRAKVDVTLADTGKTLYEKLQAAGLELFKRTWPSIRAGDWHPLPVEADAGSYHRDQQFWDLMRIDPDRRFTAREWMDRLRALTFPPYDNAYIEVDGKRYFLRLEVYEAADNGIRDRGSAPSAALHGAPGTASLPGAEVRGDERPAPSPWPLAPSSAS